MTTCHAVALQYFQMTAMASVFHSFAGIRRKLPLVYRVMESEIAAMVAAQFRKRGYLRWPACGTAASTACWCSSGGHDEAVKAGIEPTCTDAA